MGFGAGVDRWIGGLGGLRDTVRQSLLAEQLASALSARGPGPFRVLDVGCGQGTQALILARAGHTVTGIDSSAELLRRFASALEREPAPVRARVSLIQGDGEDAPSVVSGPFDVVCCHGVLMYLKTVLPMAAALSQVAADDATLSLLVRNGLALAMRDGLRGRWAEASAAFDRVDYVNRLGLSARAHTPDELDRAFAPWGWRRRAWWGIRIFTDHRDGEEVAEGELDLLLDAERRAAARDPYRQVAALHHLLYARAAAP